MASPQSNSGNDAAGGTKEKIMFRFCTECSNMLYPKEDPDTRTLNFTCRTCQYTEKAETSCVFRNFLSTSAGETAGVTQDVGSDPTVSSDCHLPPIMCLACDNVLVCNTCGVPSGDLLLVEDTHHEQRLGGCQFALAWGGEDPFDEYDEERLDDDANLVNHHESQNTTRAISSSGSTSDAFSDDSIISNR